MRRSIGTKRQRSAASGNGREFSLFGNQPDQLALVWGDGNSVVAASPLAGPGGSYTLDVARFPSDTNLGASVEMRRRNQLSLPQISQRTVFTTVVPNFSERTRILALDGERLAYDDDTLSEWLVNAEQQMLVGTDKHPIFETSLEDTACTVSRLPNGQVTLTEVPRDHVSALRQRLRPLIPGSGTIPNLIVETPVRCAARYVISRLHEGAEILRPGKESEATAFLLIGTEGFSFGLWSPRAGLFSEYSFLAPQVRGDKTARGKQTASGSATDKLDDYLRQALDQLFLQLSPDRLEHLGLSSYAQIVWAAEKDLGDRVAPITKEYSEKSGLDFVRMPVPSDEAVAGGLLLGSFSFGTSDALGARILPVVNLARDLLVHADTEEVERRRFEAAETQRRRNQTIFAILAAPVIVFALLAAFTADIIRERATIAYRDSRAEARTAELKPALDRRRSYEANLQWYQEFVKQVSLLRKQQPIGTGLLYQLNSSYPVTIDPSFYISEMKLGSKGELEIKGLARNKDAIAAFLKSLEFAGGPESGSRLFGNLAYEVQESVPAQQQLPAGTSLPTLAGSTLRPGNGAPGIVNWSVKGIYLPVADIAPQDQKAKPGQPAAPAANTQPAK